MSPGQQRILNQLLNESPTAAAKAILKRTRPQFVLEFGWWYEPVQKPEGLKFGEANECFLNTLSQALFSDSLTYCEGYAIVDEGRAVHHAWLTEGKGHAIDLTWRTPGVAYAGVPFKAAFVSRYWVERKDMACLLDDWAYQWPLLCELGDHPEEWLAPEAAGVAKLSSANSRDDPLWVGPGRAMAQ